MSQITLPATGNNSLLRGDMHIKLAEKPYSLSIRIYPDGFSLSVCNENNEVLSSEYHHSGEQEWEMMLNSSCSSLPDFQFVTLIAVTDFYTLIPATLFNSDKTSDYIQLQHPDITDTSEILHTYYKHADAMLIYAYNKKAIKAVQSVFPQINIRHHLHHLIEECHVLRGQQISITIKSKSIDCLASHNNNIQLLNSFAYQTEEDIVYHVLNILHHLQFDPETTHITIYRDNGINIKPEEILGTYIPLINCKDIPTGL